MKRSILPLACGVLMCGGIAFAAPAGQMPSAHVFSLGPSCAPGFGYSVKEQFGGPNGHLWFICRTPDIQCPGMLSANVVTSGNSFRFDYKCTIMTANIVPACAAGFAKGSISAAANIPGCMTPMLTCPANFMKMSATSTLSPDKRRVLFEYQCYRPG